MMPTPPQNKNPMTEEDQSDQGAPDDSGADQSDPTDQGDQTDQGGQPPINGGQLQALLFQRVKALSPQEMRILDSIITPTTVPVLFKLFPELGVLFDKGSQLQGQQPGGQPGGAPGGGQPPQPPQPTMPGVSRGLTGGA